MCSNTQTDCNSKHEWNLINSLLVSKVNNSVSDFFLAMMAPDIGLNLTSFDPANYDFEDDINDNSGCETEFCKPTTLFLCASK